MLFERAEIFVLFLFNFFHFFNCNMAVTIRTFKLFPNKFYITYHPSVTV